MGRTRGEHCRIGIARAWGGHERVWPYGGPGATGQSELAETECVQQDEQP